MDRGNEKGQQVMQAGIGADFLLELARVGIDPLPGEFLGGLEGRCAADAGVLEEIGTRELPRHDGFVIPHEFIADVLHAVPDEHAPELRAPLPRVRDLVIAGRAVFLELLLELVRRENAHLHRILQVQHRVADIVGRLHQVGQGTPGPTARLQLAETQLPSHGLEIRQLRLVDVELALLPGVLRSPGVFQQRADARAAQPHAAPARVHLGRADDSQRVRVSFVGLQILQLRGTQAIEIALVFRLGEPLAQGVLARMPERRIADVVRQAGHLDDVADVVGRERLGQATPRLQRLPDPDAYAPAHGRHLDAVRQTVVDMVVLGHGVHLGLAAQAAKCPGKDNPVVVPLVLGPGLITGLLR